MKLEDQVCSLELAKRLKELGVKQESYFYWNIGMMDWKYLKVGVSQSEKEFYSAFTVAELGEQLPHTLGSPPKQIDVEQYKYFDWYGLQASDYIDGLAHLLYSLTCATEADARAKMLIYLLENGLMP